MLKFRRHDIEFRQTDIKPGDTPRLHDVDQIITSPTAFYHDGELVGLYVDVRSTDWIEKLRAIALNSPSQTYHRMSGIASHSAVYGSMPYIPLRTSYCRKTKVTTDLPKYYHGVEECAREIDHLYATHLPDAYAYNHAMAREIEPDYMIGKTCFTTCNFNLNHAIKYHRDSGNLKDVYSNVIILKKGLIGGQLVFPEWNIALAQEDGYLGIFDGQKYLHGCTPVKKTHPNGYRCSTVFYALSSMTNCLPPAEELEAGRKRREKTERNFRND